MSPKQKRQHHHHHGGANQRRIFKRKRPPTAVQRQTRGHTSQTKANRRQLAQLALSINPSLTRAEIHHLIHRFHARRRAMKSSSGGGLGSDIWNGFLSFMKGVVPYTMRGTSFGTPGSYLTSG